MAYQIQKHCANVTHVIYEKNHDLGGTWLENKYPGAACDIPSHAYTYNFALNPDWPKFFSEAADIKSYLDKVVDCFGLRKYMTFDTEVVGCWWEEKEGMWRVKLKETKDGKSREFEETCHLLLHGTGILNNFKWPKIPGLDQFKGKVVHTARWPENYQKQEWANDRVAIIGSGASVSHATCVGEAGRIGADVKSSPFKPCRTCSRTRSTSTSLYARACGS